MTRALAILLLLAAVPARAQEDAAHQADRLRTRALNAAPHPGYNGAATVARGDAQAFARASADYRARLEAWRRRVAACQAGDVSACGP